MFTIQDSAVFNTLLLQLPLLDLQQTIASLRTIRRSGLKILMRVPKRNFNLITES